MKPTPSLLLACLCIASGCATVNDAEVAQKAVAVMKASFNERGQAKLDRLDQDDAQKLCSIPPSASLPKDVADGIEKANLATIKYPADGKLLVLENLDQPGMVGTIGTILGQDQVNIADMSLSRLTPGGTAYMVVRVDTEPSESARAVIKSHAAIKLAKFVQL